MLKKLTNATKLCMFLQNVNQYEALEMLLGMTKS